MNVQCERGRFSAFQLLFWFSCQQHDCFSSLLVLFSAKTVVNIVEQLEISIFFFHLDEILFACSSSELLLAVFVIFFLGEYMSFVFSLDLDIFIRSY